VSPIPAPDSVVLSPFLTLVEHEALPTTCTLAVVLESYDVKSSRNNVQRFRDGLVRPPSLEGTNESAADAAKEEEKPETETETENPAASNPEEEAKLVDANVKSAKSKLQPQQANPFTSPISVDMLVAHATGASSSLFSTKKNVAAKAGQDFTKSADYEYINKATATMSPYNPPLPTRRLHGDLYYLDIKTPSSSFSVTASPTGFYVNNSATSKAFDATAAKDSMFSHDLFTLVCAKDPKFKSHYTKVVEGILRNNKAVQKHAVETKGYENPLLQMSTEMTRRKFDASVAVPSWFHVSDLPQAPNNHRAEAFAADNFGCDEPGILRDWNEELQSAREMPVDSGEAKVLRARVIHKTLTEFTDAAVSGVVAICNGQILPMNGNETTSNRVYVYNNIFFSVAGDAAETFKVTKGDKASRKTVNKDAACMGQLHEMDIANGLYTFATTVVDYLGLRIVCQSIAPGVFSLDASSETSKFLEHGAVDYSKPLKTSDDMQELLTKTFSEAPFNIPVRSGKTVPIRAAIEAKGIACSDNRKYILDVNRVTPRDANWLPQSEGGTGVLEAAVAATSHLPVNLHTGEPATPSTIPSTLDDDEFTAYTLRSELISAFKLTKIQEMLSAKKTEVQPQLVALRDANPDSATDEAQKEALKKGTDEIIASFNEAEKTFAEEVNAKYVYNPNVFFPSVASYLSEDEEHKAQWAADEELVREAAKFLVSNMIPLLNSQILKVPNSIPLDGVALTDFLHTMGVNMRYLGAVANHARAQFPEGHNPNAPFATMSKTMPMAWIHALETEMVARSAKHVLDKYMAQCPLQCGSIVAAVLSALVSQGPETVAEQDKRESKATPGVLVSNPAGGSGCPPMAPTYDEVWEEIRADIGRRFRYNLGETPAQGQRAIPLLRRVCQRSGVRLNMDRKFPFDGKKTCKCGENFPISAADLYEIVPTVKSAHTRRYPFLPTFPAGAVAVAAGCNNYACLPEIRANFEMAKNRLRSNQFQEAYIYAEQCKEMLGEIVGPLNGESISCLDIQIAILGHFGDTVNTLKLSGVALVSCAQLEGIDSSNMIARHRDHGRLLHRAGHIDAAVQHYEIAARLVQYCSGPNHPEVADLKLNIAALLQQGFEKTKLALEWVETTLTDACHTDLFDKVRNMSYAAQLADHAGEHEKAVGYEKAAYDLTRTFYGPDNEKTKASYEALAGYMRHKVTQNVENEKNRDKLANQMADELMEEEGKQDKKKKKKKKSKGKN
jgi:protein TIF31